MSGPSNKMKTLATAGVTAAAMLLQGCAGIQYAHNSRDRSGASGIVINGAGVCTTSATAGQNSRICVDTRTIGNVIGAGAAVIRGGTGGAQQPAGGTTPTPLADTSAAKVEAAKPAASKASTGNKPKFD